jgi:alpha-tubulin suppressor-like RCC1 family protein
MSSVSVGHFHALALAEDGLVYAWGENIGQARGVRVGCVAAVEHRSYAVADTGELWAWGTESEGALAPLGHGEQLHCSLPKRIESLRGIEVDSVVACPDHALALAADGSVYARGSGCAARFGALGLGTSIMNAGVLTPQRIPELRVACGL